MPAHRMTGDAVDSGLCCPLCGHDRPTVFHEWADFRVLSCPKCRFRFTDLSQWNYPYAEADYYAPASVEAIVPRQPHLIRRLHDIQRKIRSGRALDIGCGKGELAVLMAEAGFETEAIDESKLAIAELAKCYPGVTWHCGNVLEHIDELGQFDVVTMFHVLEHLPHPVAALEKICRLLAPRGLLVIELPNAGGLQARLKGPRWQYFERHHVNYFTAEHLQMLAVKLQLEVVGLTGFYHLSHPQNIWWKDCIKSALATVGFKDVISITLQAR